MLVAVTLLTSACNGSPSEEDTSATQGEMKSSGESSFVARGTAYYPANNAMEGGFKDMQGKPLQTLQQFLSGKADYVSVAMDSTVFSYGQRLRIHELNDEYGKEIVFRVVDTGGAFKGKKKTRMDICVANAAASDDSTINGTLHVDVVGSDEAVPPVSSSDSSSENDIAVEKGSSSSSSSGLPSPEGSPQQGSPAEVGDPSGPFPSSPFGVFGGPPPGACGDDCDPRP
jgi:3D (Asp-Asp-Asp) domain-containing protein